MSQDSSRCLRACQRDPSLGKNCAGKVVRYFLALKITGLVLVFQFLVAVFSGNLALFSDTIHVASDFINTSGALFSSVICFYVAGSDEWDSLFKKRFAYFGLVLLFLGSLYVFYEAYDRYLHPVDILARPVVVMAALGALGNFLVHRILHSLPEEAHDDVHHVFEAHVWSDLLLSCAVILSALLVWLTGRYCFDLLFSAAIACYMMYLSVSLFVKLKNNSFHHH